MWGTKPIIERSWFMTKRYERKTIFKTLFFFFLINFLLCFISIWQHIWFFLWILNNMNMKKNNSTRKSKTNKSWCWCWVNWVLCLTHHKVSYRISVTFKLHFGPIINKRNMFKETAIQSNMIERISTTTEHKIEKWKKKKRAINEALWFTLHRAMAKGIVKTDDWNEIVPHRQNKQMREKTCGYKLCAHFNNNSYLSRPFG